MAQSAVYSETGKLETESTLRIPPRAFASTIILFMVLALISAITRTVLRFRYYRKLTASDYILIISAVILVGAQSATVSFAPGIYQNGPTVTPSESPNIRAARFAGGRIFGEVLVFAVIYGIKLSFAAFFKQLVARVRPLEIHWWFVIVFTILATIGVIVATFLVTDDMHFLIIASTLDIVSDVLLVSIPIRLVWNLQKRLSQRLVIGGILSISLVLVILAIIRAALARPPGAPENVVDIVWVVYWSCIEADVAVLLLSLTIFSNVFSYRHTSRPSASASAGTSTRSRGQQLAERFGWVSRGPRNTSTTSQEQATRQLPYAGGQPGSWLAQSATSVTTTIKGDNTADREFRKYMPHEHWTRKNSDQGPLMPQIDERNFSERAEV